RVDLRGDRVPDLLQVLLVGVLVAAGHQRRAEARALFATGHAGADEEQAFFAEIFFAADRVGPERIATVDDDVTRLEYGDQAVDDRVRGLAGLDEDDGPPRLCQRLSKLLQCL